MDRSGLDVFEPVLGLPSWLVRKGIGSFITLEFGDPTLTIGDPKACTARTATGEALSARRRQASVHGEWHLWIYCCLWTLELDGTELAWCESDDSTVDRALNVLNGQALTKVEVRDDAWSRFQFDLGCVLMTRPAPEGSYGSEPVDQWMLYQPGGEVLTLVGDGTFVIESGDASDDGARP